MTAALHMPAPQLLVPELDIEHWLYIDFETFYDDEYTLKKLTTADYVRDERFQTLGVGVFDGESEVWFEHDEFAEWARTVPWDKTAVVLHHAQFDGLIMSYHYGIHPAFLCCTMSMARAYGIDGGVSLANLGVHFGIGQKGREVENARGKRRQDFTREEWLRYGEYCLQDVRLTKGIFDTMMAGAGNEAPFPEAELWTVDSAVRSFTEPRLFIDRSILQQFLAEEKEKKKGLLARIERDRSIVLSNEKFAIELRALDIEPPRKMSKPRKDGSIEEIYAFAKTDVGMQELLEHEDDDVRFLAEARVAVKSTINETRTERLLRLGTTPDGLPRTCPVYYLWYGAHTGRHSGGGRMNFQNFERTNKRNPRKGILRKALLAPLGHKCVVADSGQIEARITAWLAGHDDLLEAFRQRRDVYSELASEFFNRKIDRKNNPDDEIPGQVGKVGALGFGFQQGWFTAAQNFLKGVQGAPPIAFGAAEADAVGADVNKFYDDERKLEQAKKMLSRLSFEDLVVHCAVTDKIVRKWREVNKPIVQLWKTMEQVLEAMLEDDANYTFGPGECLRIIRHAIVLPNGLKLRYPGLKYVEDGGLGGHGGFSYLGQYGKMRKHIYGGALTENVVQALARVVVFDQLTHTRAVTGIAPSLSTHDEGCFITPDEQASHVLQVLMQAMRTPPAWAKGLPLSVEGGVHQSYGHAKA